MLERCFYVESLVATHEKRKPQGDLKRSKLTLEEGDGDLELSSLSLHSSSGEIVTSGTVVSSASLNEEGRERGINSGDRGSFPSDTRRLGKVAPSFTRQLLLSAVLCPHPSANVKVKVHLT